MTVSAYGITTVITPPTATDLTTMETWKDDWGIKSIEHDSFLRRAISRASTAAQNFCNRTFSIATYQDVIRLENPYRLGNIVRGGRDPIMMGRWPLVSVTSITEKNAINSVSLVAGTDFELDAPSGLIYRLNEDGRPRDWPTDEIVVVYQAGYTLPGQTAVVGIDPLPLDIEDAVGRMVWARYAERRRDPFIKSEVVEGVGTTNYIVGTPNSDGGNMSPDVIDILNNYRVMVVG